MAGINNIEKVGTNIVLLPADQAEAFELLLDRLREVFRDPQIGAAIAPLQFPSSRAGFAVMSMKDQVDAVVLPDRIQLRDQSEHKPGSARFPEIASKFAALLTEASKVGFRAYGWNYEVEFDCESEELPSQVIAKKFVATDTIKKLAGIEIEGAGLTWFYRKGDARYALDIRPKGNAIGATRFFAHLNAHFDVHLPDEQQLEESFTREYEGFISTLKALLE